MPGPTVLVTGAGSPLGERVVARFGDAGASVRSVSDAVTDRSLASVDLVVHLARPSMLGPVLDAAADVGVERLVVTSSTTVYGAWPDNPVPLTEESPLRPNPGFSFAAAQAEGERLAAEWRDRRPGASVAVLRLAPMLLPSGDTWASARLATPSLVRPADLLAPVQVVHVDDAAAAVVHAALERLDGTYNVAAAPTSGETARALSARGVPAPLPERAGRVVESLAWKLRLGGAPAAALPYRDHPWIVAVDRIGATGWEPTFTTEEVLVAGRPGSWWRELSPKRRQELALSVAGGSIVAAVGLAGVAARAARLRTSRRG